MSLICALDAHTVERWLPDDFECGHGALIAMSIMSVPQGARAAEEPLLLEVEINGYLSGKVGEFVLRDGVLMARPSELRDIGVKAPLSESDEPVAVAALPGLSLRIDTANQILRLTAANSSLIPERLTVPTPGTPTENETSATGMTLNYDISTVADGSNPSVGALFDMRVFAPWGVISSGVLTYASAHPGDLGGNTITIAAVASS